MNIRLNDGTLLNGVLVEDLEELVRLGVLPRSQSADMSHEDYAMAHKALIPSKENFDPPTVTIGNQVWMAMNLAVDDGGEGITYNPENDEVYYTWDAAMRVANSIPGWHLPTAIEWNEAALVCGAMEKPHGINPNHNDYRDAQELKYKLGIELVGYLDNGYFRDVGRHVGFWTATEFSSTYAHYRIFATGDSMESYDNNKTGVAYSVRLVKDCA